MFLNETLCDYFHYFLRHAIPTYLSRFLLNLAVAWNMTLFCKQSPFSGYSYFAL